MRNYNIHIFCACITLVFLIVMHSFSFLSILQLPFFSSGNVWANLFLEWFGLEMASKATKYLVQLPYSRLHEYKTSLITIFSKFNIKRYTCIQLAGMKPTTSAWS